MIINNKDSKFSAKDIELLAEELSEARKIYYGQSEEETASPLSDEEYDTKLLVLEEYEDIFPELFSEGSLAWSLLDKNGAFLDKPLERGKGTVKHDVPMLSLAKAKDLDSMSKFFTKVTSLGSSSFKLQPKLDGFALSVKYRGGLIERISSRGDGKTGDDFSFLIPLIKSNNSNLSINGIPLSLEVKKDIEIRGEIVISKSNLKSANENRKSIGQEVFKNERNAIVGIIKKAEKGLDYSVTVDFVSYASIDTNSKQYINLDEVVESNSSLINISSILTGVLDENKISNIVDFEQLKDSLESYREAMDSLDFLVDGAVVKPTNDWEMNNNFGSNAHHPVTQIAYKYPIESKVTEIKKIRVTVGRTGKLTPSAILEPVLIDSVIVSAVTLHNFSWIKEKDIREGSFVLITRSGGVIPYLESLVFNPVDSTPYNIPDSCPVCSGALEDKSQQKTLKCTNEECPSRSVFALYQAVRRDCLNIDGLAEKVVDDLVDKGKIKDIADFFTLTEKDLTESISGINKKTGSPIMFGEKRAKKVLSYIDKARIDTPYEKSLASLNISSLGAEGIKEISKIAPNIESLFKLEEEDISKLNLFGDIKSKLIVESLKSKRELVNKMIENGFVFNEAKITEPVANILQGISVCISGKVPEGYSNRKEFSDFLQSNGANLRNSVNSELDVLIADPEGNSSKIKKAKESNVLIIEAHEFLEKHNLL